MKGLDLDTLSGFFTYFYLSFIISIYPSFVSSLAPGL